MESEKAFTNMPKKLKKTLNWLVFTFSLYLLNLLQLQFLQKKV